MRINISNFLLPGTLSVNGDAREEEGNIALSLQEKDAAVGIAPGSKNLTLLRALDREEVLGPSNVYVNVRCDRRRTNDPVGITLYISFFDITVIGSCEVFSCASSRWRSPCN